MATFKATIQEKRKDGMCVVYIRCTHNRQVGLIKTDMYVRANKVDNKGNILDNDIIGRCTIKISEWNRKLNLEDIGNWSIQDIIQLLQQGSTEMPFVSYCESFISNMINNGRERTAKNYQTALNPFTIHFGPQISFQAITQRNSVKYLKAL